MGVPTSHRTEFKATSILLMPESIFRVGSTGRSRKGEPNGYEADGVTVVADQFI